ncbi:hypothetical protein SBRCBS47491_009242 [Sporothrix bragantina]|uniref:Uncharacterized protein n=1 Tax=Sporothrix bragantina TaxID=671064 RepID=A0ABP0CVT3_9PEZI
MNVFKYLVAHITGVYVPCRDWLCNALCAPNIQHRICQCRNIVDFSFASSGDTKPPNLGNRLALRAKANQHLIDALGIHNSLTTADPSVHRVFLRQATERLKRMATAKQWRKLYGFCQDGLLERAIADHQQDYNNKLKLAALIRRLCLETVMYVLFQASGLDKDDVNTVCNEINRQWVLSKFALQTESSPLLNDALARLLQMSYDRELSPQQALELILPSYEALWRVVLLTYVTVCHRQTFVVVHQECNMVDVASALGTGSVQEKRLLQIAKEGLRLFPSSKRIYRAQSLESNDASMIAANVSALHRDTDIWGPDAFEFRPDRFDDAYNGFGERIILLLVALLSTRLGSEKVSIVYNDARLDNNKNASLPTGRYDMEDWELALRNEE